MRIKNLTINGTQFNLKNMILIVGSNSTGKTRLLDELHSVVTNRKRSSSFWELEASYEIRDEDKKAWSASLVERQDNNQQPALRYFYCPFTGHNNSYDGIDISPDQYQQIIESPENSIVFQDDNILRKELTHYLSVDTRLTIQHEGQMVDAQVKSNNIPDLLDRHPKIISSINKILRRLFSKHLNVCPHAAPKIELRLSDKTAQRLPKMDFDQRIKSADEYSRWLKDNNISNIQHEGHGIRAFLHIMLTYFIPTNQILMIDEPEIHLYPSIKRKFGNEMGRLAEQSQKQMFCVTHDGDFMQGVINSGCETTVIRLSKSEQKRAISVVQYGRSDSYLTANQKTDNLSQIPFLDCVLLVEGATDRLAYEHVFKSLNLMEDIEYKFISAYGADSICNAEHIAINFNVPYVTILDFGTLIQNGNKSPTINRLGKLENNVVAEINTISEKLKGIDNIRTKGLLAIRDPDLKTRVGNLVETLKKSNVFLVPNGNLESWKIIECEKTHYAEEFILAYDNNSSYFQAVTKFLSEIGANLKKQINGVDAN